MLEAHGNDPLLRSRSGRQKFARLFAAVVAETGVVPDVPDLDYVVAPMLHLMSGTTAREVGTLYPQTSWRTHASTKPYTF